MSLVLWKLIVSEIICFLPGILGSFGTSTNTEWYQTLDKPFFQPPGYLFGPVWTVLYFLMGISLYNIWQVDPRPLRTKALIFFGVQLFLNGLWTFLFFSLNSLLWSFVEITALLTAISVTVYYFYQLKPVSAYLLIPYILWTSFALVLNLSILYLNS